MNTKTKLAEIRETMLVIIDIVDEFQGYTFEEVWQTYRYHGDGTTEELYRLTSNL